MALTDPIEREFTLGDIEMLQRAQVFHDNFVIDKVAFTAAFPHLADPFAANFQTAIDDADAIPSGAEVDSEIAVITEQLLNLLEPSRRALQKLFTYADLAWGSVAKTNTFGKSRYLKARQSHSQMKELLETAFRQASVTANKTALLAAGYTQVLIDELEDLMVQMDTLNTEQEDMKSERGTKTELRVKAYNDVWEFMRQINQASKVVFIDSPAKLTLYLLYPTESHSLPKPQGLQAVENSPGVASLTWDTVVGAETYKVYYSEVNLGEPSGDFAEVSEVGVTNFEYPITPNKRNYWKIKAYNESTSSAYSDEVWLEGVV